MEVVRRRHGAAPGILVTFRSEFVRRSPAKGERSENDDNLSRVGAGPFAGSGEVEIADRVGAAIEEPSVLFGAEYFSRIDDDAAYEHRLGRLNRRERNSCPDQENQTEDRLAHPSVEPTPVVLVAAAVMTARRLD
jgi:hypothetical protein